VIDALIILKVPTPQSSLKSN